MANYEIILTNQNDATKEFSFYDFLLAERFGDTVFAYQCLRVPNTGNYDITIQRTLPQADGTKTWHTAETVDEGENAQVRRRSDCLDRGMLMRLRKSDTGTVPVKVVIGTK